MTEQLTCSHLRASQMALVVKNLPANAGDIRDSGLIPGGGNSNPLQYSCLENPMDRGAWWAAVHRVTKSWTRLKGLSMHAQGNLSLPWGLSGKESACPCRRHKLNPGSGRQIPRRRKWFPIPVSSPGKSMDTGVLGDYSPWS